MSGDGGGFLRSPSSSFVSTYSSASGGQSRADEPAQTPQQRDEDQARADLVRAGQLAAEAKKLDHVPAHEWQEQRDQIAKRLDAFAAQLQTPQVRSEAADRDREKTAGAVTQARDALAKAKPPRAGAVVAGEDAIAESVADKSIGPEAVIAWMADLSHAERQAVWRRYQDAAHGDRRDPFAVALVNYVGRHRIADDLRGLARMTDRQLGAWRMQPPAAAGVEPDEPTGQSTPLDPRGQSRSPNPYGQSFADDTRDADHDGQADRFTAGKHPAPNVDGADQAHATTPTTVEESAHGRQLADAATGATADLQLVTGSLIASFAAARDALIPDAVEAIAGNIVGKLAVAIAVIDQLGAIVDPNHPGYAAHHALPTTPAQDVDLGRLLPLWSYLRGLLSLAEQQATDEIGPHRFNGAAVMAGAQPRPAKAKAEIVLGRLRAEAIHTVELVAIVAQVRDQFLAVDGILPPEIERQIAAQLAPLASRPVHFAFAKAALVDLGIWPYLEKAKRKADPNTIADGSPWEQFTNAYTDDRTLADVDRDATKQAQTFGAMVELGDFDQDAAIALLERNTWITYLDRAQTIISRRADTDDARKVLDMLQALDNPARAAVLEHLRRAGVLDLFAGGLPFAIVEQLADQLPSGFGNVRRELAPFYQHRDKSDHTLGHLIDQIPGVGGALEEVANVATFGFLHEHDRARRAADQGLITGEDYAASTGKAAARAGAVMVLSTATAGVAGTYAQGATAGLAEMGTAGRIAAGTLTGAAAGAAGNVGARAGSDLVDGELSSFDTYAHDAIMGAAVGGAIGGGVSTLGEAGAAFLPEAAKARFQRLAERFPDLAPESEITTAIRMLGARHSQGVARFAISTVELGAAARAGIVTLSEDVAAFLRNPRKLFDDLSGPPLATVGGYGGTSRPVLVTVDATAAQPLHTPGTLDGPALHVMHAERLPDGLGSRPSGNHADDLGDGPETRGMHEIDPLGQEPHQKRLPAAKDVDPNVSPDAANSGFWADENARGNTDWYSDNQLVNEITGYKPIQFKDGYPVLDPYALETVHLERMIGSEADFIPCDIELARRNGQLKPNGQPNQQWAKDYREANGLTWHHHQDRVRMQLLPFDLHSNIPHAGGASAARGAPTAGGPP